MFPRQDKATLHEQSQQSQPQSRQRGNDLVLSARLVGGPSTYEQADILILLFYQHYFSRRVAVAFTNKNT